MTGSSSVPLVVAAVVLGAAVVVGSVLIRDSLDRGTEELAAVGATVADLDKTLKNVGTRPAPPPSRAAGRPDPTQRYTLKTDDAPAIGPKTAKVEIVEFSDFQ